CPRIEDTELRSPCPRPVSDDGKVTLLAKRPPTAVYLAAVPHAVAIQVQIPFACTGTEKSDSHSHLGSGGSSTRFGGGGGSWGRRGGGSRFGRGSSRGGQDFTGT